MCLAKLLQMCGCPWLGRAPAGAVFNGGVSRMFGKDTKVTVRGKAYDLIPLTEDAIVKDALVRLRQGSTVRRVIAIDEGDVILRGVRSDNVLEAVPVGSLLDQWELMKPAKHSQNTPETKA